MKVKIEIDSRWQRIVRSPIFYVVAALQGVAITFAPLFLYQCGQKKWFGYEPVIVPVCFAVIFLVGMFYFALGGAVIRELLKRE